MPAPRPCQCPVPPSAYSSSAARSPRWTSRSTCCRRVQRHRPRAGHATFRARRNKRARAT
eukprot:gene915-biopygen165